MRPPPPAEPPTVLTPGVLREWALDVPDAGGGKEQRGEVLVVGGSASTPGAVLLAGIAALRAGAGKLTLAAPSSTAVALAVAVPESGVTALPETADGAVRGDAADALDGPLGRAAAVLVGPGLADPEQTAALLDGCVRRLGPDALVALDAMALGVLGKEPGLADGLRGRLVLTPNTTEAGFLLGRDESDPLAAAREIAERYGAVVALASRVAAPDGRAWTGESGHIGLGTSGSGDVLAGLVAGVLARSGDPAQAACWGVHLHAAAGDRLAARVGRLGFLARELLDEAPRVLAELQT